MIIILNVKSAQCAFCHFREDLMAWKTPRIREICIGMEINAYMPSEL